MANAARNIAVLSDELESRLPDHIPAAISLDSTPVGWLVPEAWLGSKMMELRYPRAVYSWSWLFTTCLVTLLPGKAFSDPVQDEGVVPVGREWLAKVRPAPWQFHNMGDIVSAKGHWELTALGEGFPLIPTINSGEITCLRDQMECFQRALSVHSKELDDWDLSALDGQLNLFERTYQIDQWSDGQIRASWATSIRTATLLISLTNESVTHTEQEVEDPRYLDVYELK